MFAVKVEMMKWFVSIAILVGIFCGTAVSQRPGPRPATTVGARTITIATEPRAIIWIDEVRRGSTN